MSTINRSQIERESACTEAASAASEREAESGRRAEAEDSVKNETGALKLLRRCCSLLCHQRAERCFVIRGYLMPICARCTGITVSFCTVMVLLTLNITIHPLTALAMLGVMCADWGLQALGIKESTNIRRFITGLIGGFGMSYSFFYVINFFTVSASAY